LRAKSGSLTLDRLRKDGEAFMEEISREYLLAATGHKATADFQPIYAKYAHVMNEESLALTVDAFKSAKAGSEEHRSARLLLEWQAEAQSARELAPLDEKEIAWENSAMITLPDGSKLQFEEASIEMGNATDRGRRLAIELARAKLVESGLAPLKREHLQREREITESLELAADYNSGWEALSGVSLKNLAAQCSQFLKDTEDMWRETYREFVPRVLGIAPEEATRADAIALLRAREFDAFFRAEDMEREVHRQVRDMGIDPTASGRIRLDTADRPGKRSRAFCSPVLVPDEVHLVLRPHGGQTDWSTFLHELGHALHFAYTRDDLAFEYLRLGDNSVTESYAMLFDHQLQDAGWLKRYTKLGEKDVPRFLRSAGFEELQFLRRYCAKLLYEVELYGGKTRWESLPDLYVQILTDATTFKYNRADAFVDVDLRYYSARYLRAWQQQSLVAETLTERFDIDWWRNPKAGPWIVEQLFGEGQRELAQEIATRVSGKPLSFAPLVRKIETLLG
jgi:hypothetical protein